MILLISYCIMSKHGHPSSTLLLTNCILLHYSPTHTHSPLLLLSNCILLCHPTTSTTNFIIHIFLSYYILLHHTPTTMHIHLFYYSPTASSYVILLHQLPMLSFISSPTTSSYIILLLLPCTFTSSTIQLGPPLS